MFQAEDGVQVPAGKIPESNQDNNLYTMAEGALPAQAEDEVQVPAGNIPESNQEMLALSGYVFDEANQNVSWAMKCLLKIHVRLGHLGIKYIQRIGR